MIMDELIGALQTCDRIEQRIGCCGATVSEYERIVGALGEIRVGLGELKDYAENEKATDDND